jgi:hypothetical protein
VNRPHQQWIFGLIATLWAAPALAADHHVTIVNATDTALVRFYASTSDKESWNGNMLTNRVIKPGESIRVNVVDGSDACLFDFRADFEDGDKLLHSKIDVCRISSYRYSAK